MAEMNPYVGPRAFLENETLFGRDDEICRMLDLVLADRIVLLYSPSGAGKTSLVQAGVIPRMRQEGFAAFGGIRVNTPIPQGITVPPGFNRYAFSALASIERGFADVPIARELARLTLPQYFAERFPVSREAGGTVLLHFDQFEELITLDEADFPAKRDFCQQLGTVLRDRRFFAIFAMREEMIAAVHEYAPAIPTRLDATFRLNFLSTENAEKAIRLPAAAVGVNFSAAPQLARDLSLMAVQGAGGVMEQVPGPWVEPVQLQVVCRSLWTKPRKNANEISESDRMGVVDVDSALGEYYDDCVRRTAATGNVKERTIREWIADHLITSRGVRAQVLRDVKESLGLPNEVIDLLRDDHLIRSEERRGQVWYELAHDRLVQPIRASNLLWAQSNLSPFQSRALEWDAAGRKARFLLRGDELVIARRWAAEHADELTPNESAFLAEAMAALDGFERAAIEWEVAGRDPKKLVPPEMIRAARAALAARTSPLSPNGQAFMTLSEDRARSIRRAKIGQGVIAVFAVLFVLAVVGAAYVWTTAAEEKEISKSSRTQLLAETMKVKEEQQMAMTAKAEATMANKSLAKVFAVDPTEKAPAVDQVIDAHEQITALARTRQQKPSTKILYYQKERDTRKLASALDDLGFDVKIAPAKTDIPTNCIWYGPQVPENDVKLVAYALIRAGIELEGVQPMRDYEGNEQTILVGNNPRLADQPSFTVAAVESTPLPALERQQAQAKLGVAGVVRTFDNAHGEGFIDSPTEGRVYFRTFGDSTSQFEPGQAVTFDAYSGTGRSYAIHVKPDTKQSSAQSSSP